MAKVITLSILLVLVYQFDEIVRMFWLAVRRISNRRYRGRLGNTDQYVGTALTIALMPLVLNYVLLSEWDLATKMLTLFATYVGFAVAAAGVSRVVHELEEVQKYHGWMSVIAASQVIGGMFYPALHQVPWRSGREGATYAKLAFLLSLPPLAGFLFSRMFETPYYSPEFLDYIDVLIVVMVGGLFINFTIRALEKYFARVNMGVLGYYRIVLGLGVAFFLMW